MKHFNEKNSSIISRSSTNLSNLFTFFESFSLRNHLNNLPMYMLDIVKVAATDLNLFKIILVILISLPFISFIYFLITLTSLAFLVFYLLSNCKRIFNSNDNQKYFMLLLSFISIPFLLLTSSIFVTSSFDKFNLKNNYYVSALETESKPQPSTYRLIGSSNSYAQYMPWHPCLNGSIMFEFKTHEPNGILLYAQSLPYKYIQLSLTDGNLRLRMRIGEKDNPRGIFLVYNAKKLNDEKWHEVKIVRLNERTLLTIDGENLYHVHKDANLEGYDLYFGEYPQDPNYYASLMNSANNNNNLLVVGGIPNNLETFDLSLGTALFEHRFNGFIKNLRVLNCSSPYLTRLNVISSNSLRYVNEQDACMSNPCLNHGVCSVVADSTDNYQCDCSYTQYEGKKCDKCKFYF